MSDSESPIAATTSGPVRGRADGGIVRWLGVPYAAPPARFEPPRAPEPWAEPRDMTDPGRCAPQKHLPFPGLDPTPLVGREDLTGTDYLRANVYAPAGAQGRPVMVFVHGGAFLIGGKDAAVHDGSTFARSGVVLIAINYRLGVEGFLPVPGAPTNLGLRDILFALRWVQDNAAAFGGDPGNVTVFGESAGAMAIADLIVSPLAVGLFRRAIVESGHGSLVRPIPVAMKLVRKLAKLLRIKPTVDGFRSVGHAAIGEAIARLAMPHKIDLRDETGREPGFGLARFVPVVGDDVVPEHPLAALRRGAGAEIDLLIGTNADEMNFFFVPGGARRSLGGLLARWLLGRSQPNPRRVLVDYGLGRPGVRPGVALVRAASDLVFRWPARQYAAAHQGRTWMYEFDWRSPACGGELGAAHALELPFVFKTLEAVTGPTGLVGVAPPHELAERIHALWVGFARDGTLPWPEFEPQRRLVHQLAIGVTVSEPPLAAARHLPG